MKISLFIVAILHFTAVQGQIPRNTAFVKMDNSFTRLPILPGTILFLPTDTVINIMRNYNLYIGDTTIILDGSKTKDPEGKPMTYLWTQVSGPAVTIINPTSSIAKVNLFAGNYVFRLKVTDASGLSASKDKKVNILQSVILPITFSSFIVKQSGTINTLTWQTSSERDGLSMIVEKSTNQTSWTAIADIAPKGIPSTYTYIDDGKGVAVIYYRVKGIDLSGAITYTPILKMNYTPPVSTNPLLTVSGNTLYYKVTTGFVWSKIKIANSAGNIVLYDRQVFWWSGTHSGTVNISSLAAGTYTFIVDGYKGGFKK